MTADRRIALAQITQESNTFAPGVSTLDDFRERALVEGSASLEEPGEWWRDLLAEFRALGRRVELVPVLRATAVAGPMLAREALDDLLGRLTRGLRAAGPVDAVALIIHGACVVEGHTSADAEITAAVRAVVGPDIPVVAGMDHHGYITGALLDDLTALVAHRTQPHQLADTGAQAARLLLRILDEGRRPVTTWRRLPLVTHQEEFTTDAGPMADWFGLARDLERRAEVWSISLFPMQPWLDVPGAGWSVVAHTDDAEVGIEVADQLADAAWALRDEFLRQTSVPVAEAIRTAAGTPGLTLLSDMGDSIFGGADGTSTVLLDALLHSDLAGPALVPVVDPAAVAQCRAASVGDAVTVRIGEIEVTGQLTGRSDGVLPIPGFIHDRVDHGEGILLEVGHLRIMITELRGVSGNHPAPYRRLGVDVTGARLGVVKTAANIQGFAEYEPTHLQVNTPGPTQSDVLSLPWTAVTRPLYPLDPIDDWRPR